MLSEYATALWEHYNFLAALIAGNGAVRMRPEDLTKPGISCSRVHDACVNGYRGRFPYTDGCQTCFCINGRHQCGGGPCQPETAANKAVCDQV